MCSASMFAGMVVAKGRCSMRPTLHRYDAVTTEGRLRWQNTLSPLNYPFLDASDGLFLNYQ